MLQILISEDGVTDYTIFTMARLNSSGGIASISGAPRKCEKIILHEKELAPPGQSGKEDR